MFAKLIAKLNDLADHHQVAFALVAIVCLACISWSVETIIEHIFPGKPLHSAILLIMVSLFFLWLSKHVILRVI